MTELQKIKLMNESMILYLKKIGKSSQRNEIIRKILNDDTCFFKIDKNDAYIILEDIGIAKDKIDDLYLKLISRDYYYHLQKMGKIQDEDKELKISYKSYLHSDLFKSKEKKYDTNKLSVSDNFSIITRRENFFNKIINKIKKFLKID